MLTPPYHFSIVAAPLLQAPSDDAPFQILYRGSIPVERNLSFIRTLRLKTIVYLRKKQLKDDDGLVRWADKKRVDLKWVKVEGMTEEALGMGRNEVGEVLKMILDPLLYPLYIADLDGISHTTLVVACLRKLQGWHSESITSEILHFEPDHEDLPLVPFITAYATNAQATASSAEQTLQLPSPPYPSWLWPSAPSNHMEAKGAPTRESARETTRERERTTSVGTPIVQSGLLPFPHPPTARRHPTMRVTFPNLPPASTNALSLSPALSWAPLSRMPSRRVLSTMLEEPGQQSLMAAAASILASSQGDVQPEPGVVLQGEDHIPGAETVPSSPSGSRSPGVIKDTRTNSGGSSSLLSFQDGQLVVDQAGDEETEYDDQSEEEDDEEDEEDIEPTSQYISALDLAGFG